MSIAETRKSLRLRQSQGRNTQNVLCRWNATRWFNLLLHALWRPDRQVSIYGDLSLPGLLVETDNATVWLTDGRTATERAAESELDNTVLVDLALDYEQAKRIALAKADQCSESAYHEVVGLFQAAGFDVSRVDDVAGMIVMRTVACIVNEAADTVNQGVCTIEALDLAMQKGVNYPLGPFAWADRIGFKILHEVLTNLSYHYGEDRYRISALIRRMLWRKIESHAPVTESPSSGE